MTPERWRQIREILYAASQMDPAVRTRYVDDRCGEDSTLRSEVMTLLAALEESGPFLEPQANQPPALENTKIGPYRILYQAGQGGMGVVYRAVRDDDYRQEVAIKLVKEEIAAGWLIERFRMERQVLALLNHPNIARLLDGGTTPDGRPYLVMEWVEGKPINEFCQTEPAPLASRLELFLQVCDAVAHAHRNLVVHRDLKPSNILITAERCPKLLDFGIARMFSDGPGGETQATLTIAGGRLLTPDYASPEQVRGEAVTTATDVYSLGAVLYELLTGARPHRFRTRTPAEWERAVCNERPTRPSIATTAAGIPSHALRGDLDKILLKALEKEPAHRYSHVEAFAADLRRHLEGHPVLARPQSLWYRASKFARRNKLLAGAAAAVVLALTAGLLVALWQARVAQGERAIAERRFELARQFAHSVLYEFHDGIQDLEGSLAVRELMLTRSLQYLDALSADARSSPALERDLAAAYERIAELQGNAGTSNLGRAEASIQSLRKALALREHVLTTDPQSVVFRRELARTHRAFNNVLSDNTEKLRHAQSALSLVEGLWRDHPNDSGILADLAISEYGMATSFTAQSRFPEAADYLRKALSHSSSSDPSNVALYHKRLGALLIKTNNLADAAAEYQAAVGIDEQLVRSHPADGRAKMNLSFDYSDLGFLSGRMNKFEDALREYRRAETTRRQLAAAEPRDARAAFALISVTRRIAWVLADLGDRKQSEAVFLRAARGAESYATTFAGKPDSKRLLADVYADIGRCYQQKWSSCQQALVWFTRARDVYRSLRDEGAVRNVENESAGCAAPPLRPEVR